LKVRTLLLVALGLASCRQDMHDQPKLEASEASAFFADGRASRPTVPGTVARGELDLDDHFHRGKVDGKHAETFPGEIPLTREFLERGRQRYDIYCSPCHSRVGDGDGLVVQRGMRRPSSLHIERLQAAPVGYFFDVITNGFGAMFDYREQIPPADRWAIVAYIRALQKSQNARIEDVPPADRERLTGGQ
jgi:hypothetical protein